MRPGRAGCLGLLLVTAVVRVTAVVSDGGRESMRSAVPGAERCSSSASNDGYSDTERVDIRPSQQILPSVVDIWLSIQVRASRLIHRRLSVGS